jgi:hypothetical protein
MVVRDVQWLNTVLLVPAQNVSNSANGMDSCLNSKHERHNQTLL